MGVLLCGLIRYKQGEKAFSQWVHKRSKFHLSLLPSPPDSPLFSPLPPQTTYLPSQIWLPQLCLYLQNCSKPQPALAAGCQSKDSHSPSQTLLFRPITPLELRLGHMDGDALAVFWIAIILTVPLSEEKHPPQVCTKWKPRPKKWTAASGSEFKVTAFHCGPCSLVNFTASSLLIYAHLFLPGACTFSLLLWVYSQYSTPFLTHLCYCPPLLILFPIFKESQRETDGPATHRWVGSLFARPILLLQDSHWGDSDPNTPLGRASRGVSLRAMGRHLSRGDEVWQRVPDAWTPPRNNNPQILSQELPTQETWDWHGLNTSISNLAIPK